MYNEGLSKARTLSKGQWHFGHFGLAYHRAARLLASQQAKRKRPPAEETYPIVFLFRHSVELYLKSIIHIGATVLPMLEGLAPELRLNGDLFRTHRIDHLIATANTVLEQMGIRECSPVHGLGSYADLKRCAIQLSKIDEGSYSFRYPIDAKGETVRRSYRPNLSSSQLDAVASYLGQCDCFLQQRWREMVSAHIEAEAAGDDGHWPDNNLSGFKPSERWKPGLASRSRYW